MAQQDPDTGLSNYTYNGYDELKTSTAPGSLARSYFYDTFGRLDHIEDTQGITAWKYDQGINGVGRISETISPTGQHVHYSYETPTASANRGLMNGITYAIDGIDYSVGVEYDGLGRTSRVHYPTRSNETPIVAEYGYDPSSGALAKVQEIGSGVPRPLWKIDEVAEGHLLQRESFGNGASTTYGYHPTRQWLEHIETTLASNPIQSLGYKHYGNGLVQEKNEAGGPSHSYTYDLLNRLETEVETSPGGSPVSTAYTYDDIGNIKFRGANFSNYRPDQPHLVDSINGNVYHYDGSGNVDSRVGPDVPRGRQNLRYTPFNLPTAISSGSQFAPAETTRFEYSADEERVVRRDEGAGVTHHFVGDLYERSLDYVDATIEQRFRLFAGERAIGEIVRKDGVDKTLYFHNDHLGSVDTLSDDANDSFPQHFDPFGAKRDVPPQSITRAGFTGHNSEDDVGLVDMKGRFYDPLAARFLSPDPVMLAPFSSQGMNRYSYVFNNPVNNTDPSGFEVTPGQWVGYASFTAADVGLLGYAAGWFNGIGGAVTALAASPLSVIPGGLGNVLTTIGSGVPLDGSIPGGVEQTTPTRSAMPRAFGVGTATAHAISQSGPISSNVAASSGFDILRAIITAPKRTFFAQLGAAIGREIGRRYQIWHPTAFNDQPFGLTVPRMGGDVTRVNPRERPDILDPTNHALWEIKPEGLGAQGGDEARYYILQLGRAGVAVHLGGTAGIATSDETYGALGDFNFGLYHIFYHMEGPGVIVYRVTFRAGLEDALIKLGAALGAAAGLPSGAGTGLPVIP